MLVDMLVLLSLALLLLPAAHSLPECYGGLAGVRCSAIGMGDLPNCALDQTNRYNLVSCIIIIIIIVTI